MNKSVKVTQQTDQSSRYKDMFSILSEKKVKFLLVGSSAAAVNGYPRSKMGINILVMPNHENALLVLRALDDFGAPVGYLSAEDFQKEDFIYQIGIAPSRIDILTSINGLKFEDALARSELIKIEGIPVHALSIPDFNY